MRAADTNVLLRLITRDDPRQTAAAEAFIEHGIWVSVLALAEMAWVLNRTYNNAAGDIADAIEMLVNNPHVILQEPEAVSAALDLFRAHPALGFADCLILELARQAGHVPLGTFDRGLGKIDGAQKL